MRGWKYGDEKCGDENAGMKMREWKCGDENAGMKNPGMKMPGMKMWGMKMREWKWGDENAGDEKTGDEKTRGWKTGDEIAGNEMAGMKCHAAYILHLFDCKWSNVQDFLIEKKSDLLGWQFFAVWCHCWHWQFEQNYTRVAFSWPLGFAQLAELGLFKKLSKFQRPFGKNKVKWSIPCVHSGLKMEKYGNN